MKKLHKLLILTILAIFSLTLLPLHAAVNTYQIPLSLQSKIDKWIDTLPESKKDLYIQALIKKIDQLLNKNLSTKSKNLLMGIKLYVQWNPASGDLPSNADEILKVYEGLNRKNAQDSMTNMLLILDASWSMDKLIQWEQKIDIAKDVSKEFLANISWWENINIWVLAYGNKYKPWDKSYSCNIIDHISPLDSAQKINADSWINKLLPMWATPIAKTLRLGFEIFQNYAGPNDENRIILISDGEESCEWDPISLVQEFAMLACVDVIGFDVDDDSEKQLKSIAEASGCWTYYSAQDKEHLEWILLDLEREFKYDDECENLNIRYDERSEKYNCYRHKAIDNKDIDYCNTAYTKIWISEELLMSCYKAVDKITPLSKQQWINNCSMLTQTFAKSSCFKDLAEKYDDKEICTYIPYEPWRIDCVESFK